MMYMDWLLLTSLTLSYPTHSLHHCLLATLASLPGFEDFAPDVPSAQSALLPDL